MTTYTHATVRLVRWAEPVTLPDVGPAVTDPAGSLWLLGSDDMASHERIGSRTARVWASLGLHAASAAEPGPAPAGPYDELLSGAVESWTAVLAPYSHRGETNWAPGPLFEPGNRRSHPGPFAVITTVGFDPSKDADGRRAHDFIRGVAEVRSAFAAHAEVQASHAFWFGRTWWDPLTFTVWSSDDELRPAVYEPGEHRTRMDDYHRHATADRTSFTRLRVVRSEGTWESRPLPA